MENMFYNIDLRVHRLIYLNMKKRYQIKKRRILNSIHFLCKYICRCSAQPLESCVYLNSLKGNCFFCSMNLQAFNYLLVEYFM